MWITAVAGWALLMPEMGSWEDATRRPPTGVAGIWIGMRRDEVERFLEDDDPWCLDGGRIFLGANVATNMGGNFLFLKCRVVVRYNRWGKVEWAGPYEPDKQKWSAAPAEYTIPQLLAEKRARAANPALRPLPVSGGTGGALPVPIVAQ